MFLLKELKAPNIQNKILNIKQQIEKDSNYDPSAVNP